MLFSTYFKYYSLLLKFVRVCSFRGCSHSPSSISLSR